MFKDERGGIGKILLFIIGGIVLIAIFASVTGGGGGGGPDADKEQEDIQQVAVPGEATIEDGDAKTLTRITGVETRAESIPGNEFAKAPEGKVYMVWKAEIQNVGERDLDLNPTVYRLKTPSGEIINYTALAGGDQALQFGSTLTQGASKAGELTFEVPTPSPGQQYVLLWKPSGFSDKQAHFTHAT